MTAFLLMSCNNNKELQEQIDALETQLATLQAVIDSLQGQTGDQSDLIEALENQLAALEQQNANLSAENDALIESLSQTILALKAQNYINRYEQDLDYIDVSIAKEEAAIDGYVVFRFENQAANITFYAAVDLRDWSNNQSALSYLTDSYATDRGDGLFRAYYITPIGAGNVFTDGNGLFFETTDTAPKDLEKMAAAKEEVQRMKLTNVLVAGYGFSQVRAKEVSRSLSAWAKLSKSRSMTKDDLNILSTDLFGLEVSEVFDATEAAISGDESIKDSLINRAADHNHISPEAMSQIINKML